MKRPALPYQLPAIEYAAGTRHPALFLEMRLGKTLVAIRAVKEWKSARVLVLAPLSVLASWEYELGQEGEGAASFPESSQLDLEVPPPGGRTWTLVNFERLLAAFKAGDADKFTEWAGQFDAVIVDESTRIKNPKAMTTKLICTAFQGAAHRMILSGLPAPEGPADYVEQFRFLHGRFMGCRNFWTFRAAYFEMLPHAFEWTPKRGAREAIKEEVHRLAYILSRQEAGIGSQKIYTRRYVYPTREQERHTEQIEGEWSFGDEETQNALVRHTWLARVAGGHGPGDGWPVVSDRKAKEIVTLLRGELSGQSVLVLFRFNTELELTRRILSKAGIPCVTITGETTTEDRKARRLQIQSGAVRVALLQIKVCRYGLDFSKASTAIYYSNSYSVEDRKQSEDRIIHPQKSEPLLYIDLITTESIDETVSEAVRMKYSDSKFFLRKLIEMEGKRLAEKYRGRKNKGLHKP